MPRNTLITLTWQDPDTWEYLEARFSNVHAFGNYLKKHPQLAKDLDYLPKKPGSVARNGKGRPM